MHIVTKLDKMSFTIVSLLALFISISAFSARVEAKPLNQNQVKFRRLPPKEFSAALGSSITIECEAGGSPPPSIHWLKDGKRILQNDFDDNQLEDPQQNIQVDDVNRIALSATRSRLFIDCASYQDEAVYTCVAENPFSRVYSNTKLNLLRPIPVAALANENDLLPSALEEVAALELAAAAGGVGAASGASGKTSTGDLEAAAAAAAAATDKGLTALPQCLSQRHARQAEPTPVRIHMWTHNIIEIMKNNIILYCRSNLKKAPAAPTAPASTSTADAMTTSTSQQKQQSQSTDSELSQRLRAEEIVGQNQLENDRRPQLTWTTPDEKLVTDDQKDKYEILETGDLLIKDLRWADMGSYVCTVSDDSGSDSISTFVYPASSRGTNKRSAMPQRLAVSLR